jgi:hypothetical protein
LLHLNSVTLKSYSSISNKRIKKSFRADVDATFGNLWRPDGCGWWLGTPIPKAQVLEGLLCGLVQRKRGLVVAGPELPPVQVWSNQAFTGFHYDKVWIQSLRWKSLRALTQKD